MARISAVTLRRGACYGHRPISDVTLRRSGQAAWGVEVFIDRIGDYRGKVDEFEFEALAGFIERCDSFVWIDESSIDVTDSPTHIIEVARNRAKKTVRQYATDEPGDCWVIAELVDVLADRIEWKQR